MDDQTKLDLIASGGIVGGANIWRYLSPDPHATVEGANYFANAGKAGMKIHDIVIVVEASAGGTTMHSVTNIVAAVNNNALLPGFNPPGAGTISPAESAIAGYGTPVGGAHQASFNAATITLPNLAAAVAQLIADLQAQELLGP